MATVHTNDVGIAIRDALAMLADVETFDWNDAEAPSTGAVPLGEVDASDASNLLVELANGARFRVRITREG